jgi:hypothetical protein
VVKNNWKVEDLKFKVSQGQQDPISKMKYKSGVCGVRLKW